MSNATDQMRQVSGVTGRYRLGQGAATSGLDLFACRLKSISPTAFVAAAPVIGAVGEPITASFAPFGSLAGTIARHTSDGFVVDLKPDAQARATLSDHIAAFAGRAWHGPTEKRGEERFMPGEPRSVVILADGTAHPCLVIDYSASGAAISADLNPAEGTALTVGQIPAWVVRGFDLGFAVRFEQVQDRDEVEMLLEAPEEWRDAVRVLRPVSTVEDDGAEPYGCD